MMDIIQQNAGLLTAALNLVVAFAVWALKSGFVSRKEHDVHKEAVTKAIDEHKTHVAGEFKNLGERTLRLETTVKSMPTAADLKNLEISMAVQTEQIKGLGHTITALTRQLTLMDEFLRTRDK